MNDIIWHGFWRSLKNNMEKTDIVVRLRDSVTKGHEPTDEDAIEAADEIERLRKMLMETECELNVATNGEYLPHKSTDYIK